MRLWEGYSILNLLAAGKDAGWVIAIVLVCLTTFAVSSIFVKKRSCILPGTGV
jgi:hypothetical protein